MGETVIKAFAKDQIETFATEYVTAMLWDLDLLSLENLFRTDQFRLLDVGGGTGHFADGLLIRLPEAA